MMILAMMMVMTISATPWPTTHHATSARMQVTSDADKSTRFCLYICLQKRTWGIVEIRFPFYI